MGASGDGVFWLLGFKFLAQEGQKTPSPLAERRKDMGTRITEHPILGVPQKGSLVSFTYDGKKIQGYEGEPIAAALKAAGIQIHRYTKKEHTPRGIFCAIGRCTD